MLIEYEEPQKYDSNHHNDDRNFVEFFHGHASPALPDSTNASVRHLNCLNFIFDFHICDKADSTP